MDKQECKHTFACHLLWAVFTLYCDAEIDAVRFCDLPSERRGPAQTSEFPADEDDLDLPIPEQPGWYRLVDIRFLDWLRGEEHKTACLERILDQGNYSILDDTFDKLVLPSYFRIAETATAEQETYQFHIESLIYYYYCGWVLSVLHEFEKIVEELKPTYHPERYQSYQAAYGMFRQLERELRGELLSIEERENIAVTEATKLRAEIAALSAELALDWREAVFSAAERFERD